MIGVQVSRKSAIIAAVAVAVAVGAVAALLQPRPEAPADGGTVVANTTEQEIVSVASARSAFPFVQRWVSQYNNDDGSLGRVEISYYLDEPGGQSDLAIVGGLPDAGGSRYVPVSPQAVAVVYNVPGFPDVPSGLRLNSSLLLQMFNGSVATWDDPAIMELNPGLNLPSESIVVVHDSSNGSSLALLERYLSGSVSWPEGSARAIGPDELAATIRSTPYSIGYVDFSYAVQTRMTFAALAAGDEYVAPSMDSIDRAVRTGLYNATAGGAAVAAINSSRLDNSSYPVTGLYYAVPEQGSNATRDFVAWVTDDAGQQALAEVQYPPIYRDGRLVFERASNSTVTE
jgi:ABC-type phosphate transport system substrate-binding protein